jgi:RNA polymerase sigma-70 factor (ECF subfamily)
MEGSSESATARAAVDVLVAGHRNFLAFLERRLGDRELAEDILQAAFVRGLERIEQVRESESVVAWFYRMLRNAVIDHRRRRGSASRRLDALGRELDAHADQPLPDDRAVVCECLAALTASLPPDHAQAIRRVDLDGIAVKEFAAEAGITANAAGVRLFRARQKLRSAVARSCGTCAVHGCLDCTCESAPAPR